ncbi:MAG: mercuric reductase, partial [Bacteroidetes bacterium QS_9_68_14]
MEMSYDLLVIGGGAAGLTAAGLGASFGAKTLLVEEDRLGGDCTWTGCVPSKALLKSAHDARITENGTLGNAPDDGTRFAGAMRRARRIRREIYDDADAPEHLQEFGVEVKSGHARLVASHFAEIEREAETGTPEQVEADRVVLATGGQPAPPPLDGLANVDYLTNETLFELEERPERAAVLGGGPIGTEMAQALQRLGVQVTVLERSGRILGNDHPRLAGMLQERLAEEGVTYRLGASVRRVEPAEGGPRAATIHYEQDGEHRTCTVDALLVATGRRPRTGGLGLDAAGVDYDDSGIAVDDRCRTSAGPIWAVGDVTGRYQFTHMSEHMAKVAVTNAILKVPQKIDAGRVPWVTYTDPELAHVGQTERELKDDGTGYETYRFPLGRLDRAVCEGRDQGEIRLYATAWRGQILGASVLAPRAGELIGTVAVAMKSGASLATISDTIFPYPTYGQGVRRAADQWYAQKQRPWLVRSIQTVFGYDGPV